MVKIDGEWETIDVVKWLYKYDSDLDEEIYVSKWISELEDIKLVDESDQTISREKKNQMRITMQDTKEIANDIRYRQGYKHGYNKALNDLVDESEEESVTDIGDRVLREANCFKPKPKIEKLDINMFLRARDIRQNRDKINEIIEVLNRKE